MDPIVLTLRECMKGWGVFRGELPLFWFASYEEALTTARMVAAVQVDIREAPTTIEMQAVGEKPVFVATVSTPAAA
jgi:hypothetical protein